MDRSERKYPLKREDFKDSLTFYKELNSMLEDDNKKMQSENTALRELVREMVEHFYPVPGGRSMKQVLAAIEREKELYQRAKLLLGEEG
jgi:hypothetical protein